MRIVVAGGAGFLGSHVCRALLKDGHEVLCVDDLSSGSWDNVNALERWGRFTFRRTDISVVTGWWAEGRIDLIIHLASPASPVDYWKRPLETLEANSTGTRNLLAIAHMSGARFVYASTSEVYGDPLVHPQPESYWGNVDPIGPRSCYDEGKRFGEALVTAYRKTKGVKAAIVRIFNTYGPAMRLDDGRVIPELLRAALEGRPLPVHGDGTQTRSYAFVDDTVAGILKVALDPDLDGLVMNVGNPEEVSLVRLAALVVLSTGHDLGIEWLEGREGDPKRRCPDIGRMIDRYGWQPEVSLSEGLRRTVEWMKGANK